MMVSLMDFLSSSFVFILFRRIIFNSYAFCNNDVLLIYYFITLSQVTKVCFMFTPQIHYHCSTCYIADFLHQCIYTLQHILAYGSIYFTCRQSRSLTLSLHCNTCRTEHLDQENLPSCVLSTFSAYHARIYLLLLLVLLSVFQIAATQTSFQIFYTESIHSGASETLNGIVQAEFLSYCDTILY